MIELNEAQLVAVAGGNSKNDTGVYRPYNVCGCLKSQYKYIMVIESGCDIACCFNRNEDYYCKFSTTKDFADVGLYDFANCLSCGPLTKKVKGQSEDIFGTQALIPIAS